MTSRAIRFQIQCVIFDLIFCLAASAVGPVTGFVQYAPMLLLWPVSPQDVRGQNIAIKAHFRKSLGEHTDVSHRAAPRLIMVPKHHFRQSYSANVFKGVASRATELGLNCSYPVTGPSRCAGKAPWYGPAPDQ